MAFRSFYVQKKFTNILQSFIAPRKLKSCSDNDLNYLNKLSRKNLFLLMNAAAYAIINNLCTSGPHKSLGLNNSIKLPGALTCSPCTSVQWLNLEVSPPPPHRGCSNILIVVSRSPHCALWPALHTLHHTVQCCNTQNIMLTR